MARKGSNIYKRKDGRYEGRVPIGYKENGKLKYKSIYDRTLSGVKEKMTQFYTVRQERTVSNLKLMVQDAAEQWLAAAKLRVKPASYANYENIVAKHILPTLGGGLPQLVCPEQARVSSVRICRLPSPRS